MNARLRRVLFFVAVAASITGLVIVQQGVRADNHLGGQPLTYQGRILADGAPIPSGEYLLSVELFADAEAESRICGDTRRETQVTEGYFTHTFEDVTCASALQVSLPAVYVRVLASGGVFGARDVEVGMHPVSTGVFAIHAATGGGTVGDVVASMLSVEQFQSLRGPGWVLADGSAHPASRYAQITGREEVPDLRGVFLRGKDHGRFDADGVGNPGGDLALGERQDDEVRRHHHSVHPLAGVDDGEDTGPEVSGTDTTVRAGLTSGYGGDETRPVNVTVNYFIKID